MNRFEPHDDQPARGSAHGRPLARRIAEHRAGLKSTQTQYSAYDQWNDNFSADPGRSSDHWWYWGSPGLWGWGGYYYHPALILFSVATAMVLWGVRGCGGAGS
ncbi:MAG: hypothetical protein GEEBNDBF_00901 [bacterium]|nr:hypothetical protein [bacterium]